jgi:NTP pyrophosphatase (non-canonical NTP hydrolase)
MSSDVLLPRASTTSLSDARNAKTRRSLAWKAVAVAEEAAEVADATPEEEAAEVTSKARSQIFPFRRNELSAHLFQHVRWP